MSARRRGGVAGGGRGKWTANRGAAYRRYRQSGDGDDGGDGRATDNARRLLA